MRKGDLYLMTPSTAYPMAKCWCLVLRPATPGGWPGTLVRVFWSDEDVSHEFTIEQDHPGAVLVGRNVQLRPPATRNLTQPN